jgi:parallel beta-helix repeat protein
VSKKWKYLIFLAIILLGLSASAFLVQRVEAYPSVSIRSDGSVYPSTANITSSDNVTYSFTADINAYLVVERDDIVVDGADYAVRGGGEGTGVDIWGRRNVTIKNMKVKAFQIGIRAISSQAIIISRNTVTNCSVRGIEVYSFSSNNNVSGNTIIGDGGEMGIVLAIGVTNTTVYRNSVTNCVRGITLWDAPLNYNVIFENNVTNNSYGFHVEQMLSNTIYHNNVIDNDQAYWVNSMQSNRWDSGFEGNYWSDYNGTDLDHDGIGDTPFTITQNNTDRYPLMGPFSSFNTFLGKRVNVISNSTIDIAQYFDSNNTIRMQVSDMTENQTHGFCRVGIPHDVLSPPYNVTVNGANPIYWNDTLYDNGTHRWIYFEYEHSTVEIVIIPEFPSLVILPLLMLATLLSVIVCRSARD